MSLLFLPIFANSSFCNYEESDYPIRAFKSRENWRGELVIAESTFCQTFSLSIPTGLNILDSIV